jgi:sporulation protein YlmC with PRC-barrel domain
MPISRQYESGLRRPGSHLRSKREVLGYSIHANTGGEVGTLEDFIIEDTLWGVHNAVVALKETPSRSILLSPDAIRSISWRGKAAWVNLSRPELEKHPDFNPAQPVNRDKESRLYDYYGRPIYQVPPMVAERKGPEAGQL